MGMVEEEFNSFTWVKKAAPHYKKIQLWEKYMHLTCHISNSEYIIKMYIKYQKYSVLQMDPPDTV